MAIQGQTTNLTGVQVPCAEIQALSPGPPFECSMLPYRFVQPAQTPPCDVIGITPMHTPRCGMHSVKQQVKCVAYRAYRRGVDM